MSFITELLDNLRSHASDRIKHPVLGAFAFSWLACNWDNILYLLFYKHPIEERIDFVKGNSNLESMIIHPASLTLFFIVILPFLTLTLSSVISWPLGKLTTINSRQIRWRLVSKRKEERARAIASAEYQSTLKSHSREMSKLKAENEHIKGQLDTVIEERDKVINNYDAYVNDWENLRSQYAGAYEANKNLAKKNAIQEQAIVDMQKQFFRMGAPHDARFYEPGVTIAELLLRQTTAVPGIDIVTPPTETE
ncbi:hypothetical protein [Enterobacter cloacae]|uniref:hypothetical protein n=1 Tax=Enterobacter cloacae TaxID=550 RepID=UPI003F44F009